MTEKWREKLYQSSSGANKSRADDLVGPMGQHSPDRSGKARSIIVGSPGGLASAE